MMMMKYAMMFCLWLFVKTSFAQPINLNEVLESLQKGDTLYVNFCVASGEFGSTHRGLLLYRKAGEIFGKYVLYNYGISLLPNKMIEIHPAVKAVPLEEDSIVRFYNRVKIDYFVRKKEWRLDEHQVRYLKSYFSELNEFKSKGFSNAPDFYTVISEEKSFVVLDKGGGWNKFLEVEKMLKL